MTLALVADVDTSAHWAERAACAGMDPELFFPKGNGGAVKAKQVCARCPVRDVCLAAALEEEAEYAPWVYGVRGGKTATERKALGVEARCAGRLS